MRKKFKPAAMERELERFVNPKDEEVVSRLRQQPDGGLAPYDYYVKMFRQCWAASDPMHRDTANLTIDNILTEDPRDPQRLEVLKVFGKKSWPADEVLRPVFCADLTGEGIRKQPRDHIDVLALTLIACRRRLGFCLATGCKHPYFISKHPRQHYCSTNCLGVGRKASKRKWAKFNYLSANPKEFGARTKAEKAFFSQARRKT